MPIDSIFIDLAFDKEKDSETSKFLLKIYHDEENTSLTIKRLFHGTEIFRHILFPGFQPADEVLPFV